MKTLDNDLNGIVNKIGIFGQSIDSIREAFSYNKIKGVSNLYSPINDSDIDKIETYNNLINSGIDSESAYVSAMYNSSAAAQQLVKSTNDATISQEAIQAAMNKVTISAKAAAAASKALAIAGNMLAMWVLSQVISIAANAIDNYIHRVEKAQKALDESQQAFDKTQSEIKSLNDELEKCNKRIGEINALGGTQITKDGELEKLEAQSEELERQLVLKREEDKINAREHAKNAEKEYNILVDSEYLYDYESDSSVAPQLVLPSEELNEAIRRYGIYATEKERIDQELINAENELIEAQAEKKDTDSISKAIKELQKRSSEYQTSMDHAEARAKKMADLSIDVENAYKSIVDSGGDLTDTQLAQLESVVALNNGYFDFLKIIQRVGNEQDELDTPDVTNFNLSDEDTQKAVDNYKRQFELLATAIEKVRNEKLTGSDLYDLGKEFPELIDTTDDLDTALTKLVDETLAQVVQYLELTGASTGFINLFRQMADAAKTVETKADSVIELSQNIQTAYDLLEKVNEEAGKSGELSLDTLSSIAKQFPELDEATAKYAQGLFSLTDILGLLNQAYNNGSKAYQAEMVQRLSDDEVFWKSVVDNNKDLFETLSVGYGQDISNYKSLAIAKAKIDAELIQSLESAWSKYYSIVYDSSTGLASLSGGPDLSKASSHGTTATPEQQAAWTAAKKQLDKYNSLIKALNEASENEIELPNFGNIGADKTSSGSDNSPQTQEFDWIKQKIDSITHARERLNKVINNERTPYLEQISTLNQIVAKDKELEEASKAAAEAYHKSWEDCAAKIAESDISKIMEGSLSIEEYTGPYAENLKTAQDAWSKYQDAVSQVDDYTNQTAEDIAGQFEKIRNITNASIDRIKQHVSDVQNLLDEAEAMGLYATEAQYRNLIQYADQEISKQKALRASYIRELASIKPGTEAYEK